MRLRLSFAAGWIVIAQTIAAQEAEITFKTRVNLVSVPVVVRDSKGVPVGNLEKADFQLFDRGKLQVISRFTVERSPGKTALPREKGESTNTTGAAPTLPERFVAYLFDDIHLQFGELVYLRDSASRHLDTLARSDRAAIYTTSGMTMLDFTDDRDAWHAALKRLMPRPLAKRFSSDCPDLSYTQAHRIANRGDNFALQAATNEVMICAHLDRRMRSTAESIAQSAARRVVMENDREVRVSLSVLRDVVRRMSTTPGQRLIVLASPGFLVPESQHEKTEIIDRAIRAGVTINAIDGRGLWTDPTFDASKPGYAAEVQQAKNRFDRDTASQQADLLAEFAAGTGGTFFHNSNDLDAGFERVAAAPEYSYILGFSPQDLKMDGGYHSLKVSLVNKKGLSPLARKGYYAPKTFTKPEEAAQEEIREAIFSRQERSDLPVTIGNGFVRNGNRITLQAWLDIKPLRFRKSNGTNHNTLTISLGIFDRNGNLIRNQQKILELNIKDETLERGESKYVVNMEFELEPGYYVLRLVARDSEGEQMSARNGTMQIRPLSAADGGR